METNSSISEGAKTRVFNAAKYLSQTTKDKCEDQIAEAESKLLLNLVNEANDYKALFALLNDFLYENIKYGELHYYLKKAFEKLIFSPELTDGHKKQAFRAYHDLNEFISRLSIYCDFIGSKNFEFANLSELSQQLEDQEYSELHNLESKKVS